MNKRYSTKLSNIYMIVSHHFMEKWPLDFYIQNGAAISQNRNQEIMKLLNILQFPSRCTGLRGTTVGHALIMPAVFRPDSNGYFWLRKHFMIIWNYFFEKESQHFWNKVLPPFQKKVFSNNRGIVYGLYYPKISKPSASWLYSKTFLSLISSLLLKIYLDLMTSFH